MKFKKFISTAMVAALAAGTFVMPVSAAEWNTNGGTETVEGTGWVQEPVIDVELPGDLAFGINPLMMTVEDPAKPETTTTAQILSADYFVYNWSDVAVAVEAKTTVEAGGDVELVATLAANLWENGALKASSTENKKAAWLALMPAKTITFANDVYTMTVGTVAAGNASTDIEGNTLKATDPTTPIVFVLDAFKAGEEVKSVGGFKFAGAVDANAAFVEGDLKVKTVFKLSTITEAQKGAKYEAYKSAEKSSTTFFSTVMQAR